MKSSIEKHYKMNEESSLSPSGTGLYSKEDKIYWASFKDWYRTDKMLKSKTVIKVDFKARKVLSGVSKEVKNLINNKVV